MKNQKMYEASDKMISLIRDNYNLLQSLGSFGISLGFGDKTVKQVCDDQNVDTNTFLAVVNFTINGYREMDNVSRLSVPTLLQYLKASHDYFLGFQLPFIRKELVDALDENDNLARLILKLYDEYSRSVTLHMKYEEKTVFPYVESLLAGKPMANYAIDMYSKHHGQESSKLRELKSIIIKYFPGDCLRNNQLSATLYDIYNNEEWLALHAEVEDNIFIPAIKYLEDKSRQSDVSAKISSMIGKNQEGADALGEREKDVIVALVQGMSNKEIAEHLCISVNTVITHRRNIARKLQIHSPAGLTIYAIVNNLIDISAVKL
ncbi:MAG: LuxR C-terminal-related transcriptional regulator [Prevotella sp.]|uniref:LuxR C-terminal-related transcriptional regulator n=1 Tax=Leyella stercorea TaxID=363265 RepID=UPI001F25DA2F|nr:LuxR C-terminal-related transcriptional regulator [Leyella stercorea]MCI6132416.1 LuxR C-terminal-related transcriptional regulator [Prevotella sp.]MCF2615176.1 helix-turn-helix transcriptional regulator [Leyella stercorea]MCI6717535.1 LuxR C-terminal-related transcriptional regulator [Prevotella sp.]MDY3787103.1 LuxR C-terminal-related transcriptional regulator [Prevotella sp.]MDY4441947.1 LuxR C-terminal-related transcriptional regulator [Prevotella sp.]